MQLPSLFANTLSHLSLISQTPLTSNPNPLSSSSCPSNSPISCQNSTAAPDSCCFIYPGGQLLQTQFWDTSPSIGPDDSWTLHGLWPDLCDGSYPTYCTSAPQYYNITTLISARAPALLTTMQSYWLPNAGTLEHFWEHEWNKHGTCINTLAPSCYSSSYVPGDEVVDFFTRTVALFQTLDTYTALAAAGITPSSTKTYALADIQTALNNVTGFEAVVGCSGNMLNQAWYSFNVKGSLQGGEFVPVDPAGKGLRCPLRGIRYLPK
ncbi:Ribonuclease Trv [Lachnellula hyalina]|uniref:ribonuclease T2 n=1 Tax=Lachnellula hyalina TaxID=1316788 RepID=A0A8H8R068_9HELO|nr:Ribonuclease Trv [Lachnellula hyalina]TVY25964.1 Ribonuclease Trv [Lachnellula hyalina]